MGHWLYVHLGVSGTGSWYGFWSGAGSDIGELAIVGAVAALLRRLVAHHAERLAQAAAHHREHLALTRQHHDEKAAAAKAPRARKGVTGG